MSGIRREFHCKGCGGTHFFKITDLFFDKFGNLCISMVSMAQLCSRKMSFKIRFDEDSAPQDPAKK